MQTNGVQVAALLAVALVVLGVAPRRAAAQIYQPPGPYAMWDTWLFQDGDAYHLFFLQSEPGVTWNTLGRAVSKDLVHWTALPPMPSKGPEGAWDNHPTLTGMTVKRGDEYVLFYGSATHGQKIGIMTSPDLEHWEKHAGNPTLEIQPPHYAGSDWRDMCTFYDAQEGRWHGYVCAQSGDNWPELPTIRDKTLVAWVYLAHREQRGGSCLTLDSGDGAGDPFDGIVFGEKAVGKWMAGSEFWRRSQDDQSAYPEETAGPDERVQMAIAYAGNRITVYRNVEVYAQYEVDEPRAFGNGSAVVMGLRHKGAGENSGRFFAGAIEEARIYDRALDAPALAALEPGRPSDPRPVAQWTFEGGSTADAVGRFPDGDLHGGASIVDGKLWLDGFDDYFATPTRGPQACVAHLVSKDLIDWEYLPPTFACADFADMEVPDYFELEGRHYLLFSSARSRRDTPSRQAAAGTWYVIGEGRDGPYRVPEDPLLLGAGHGRLDNYVGRTIPFEGGRLLYHHTAQGPVTWGVPKVVRQHDDGTLWLQYWPGVGKVETRVLLDGLVELPAERAGHGDWSLDNGAIAGRATQGEQTVLWLPIEAPDAMLTCVVDAAAAERVGVVWRWDGSRGAALILDAAAGVMALENVDLEGERLEGEVVDDARGLALGEGAHHLRVMVRAHRAEVFLDDRWMFATSMPATAGRVGLLLESGEVRFGEMRIAELEPLENAG